MAFVRRLFLGGVLVLEPIILTKLRLEELYKRENMVKKPLKETSYTRINNEFFDGKFFCCYDFDLLVVKIECYVFYAYAIFSLIILFH